MKRMPNINLDRRNINRLFMNQLQSGGEAVICRGSQSSTLFKIFANSQCQRNCDSFGIPFRLDLIEMSDNKFKKINKLYQMQLEHSVRPISTISMDGRLIGYEMTYDPSEQPLIYQSLSYEELIHFLSQSKAILEYYASNDITYGDVNARNLLINKEKGTAKFCDMDNIRLGEYPIEVMARDLLIYSIIRGLDQYADAYMHNVMTLTELSENKTISRLEPVHRLVQEDYSSYFTDNVNSTLNSMENPKEFNGEYIIQYIKK